MLQEQIINSLIAAILAGGYNITVNDGDDDVLRNSIDSNRIIQAMGGTSTDVLNVYSDKEYIGFILLIPSSGDDIITNHSGNHTITNIVDTVLNKVLEHNGLI